jgi:hypothetical protein
MTLSGRRLYSACPHALVKGAELTHFAGGVSILLTVNPPHPHPAWTGSITMSATSWPLAGTAPGRQSNTAMVEAYWDVGRAIVEEEQAGRERAD